MKNAFMPAGMSLAPAPGTRAELGRFADALNTLRGLARKGWSRTRESASATGAEKAEPERLRAAFDAFNAAAARLEGSYAQLRTQVETLSQQLSAANGKLEQELIEKQTLVERQSALLAALPAGVVVITGGGTVREANTAAACLLGDPLVGMQWEDVARRLTPADCELEWIAPGPRRQRVALEEQSMTGAQCERIVLLHDITEAHAARERISRNERLAAMGEMAARVAHQLRTPLATAMLYASQLERAGMSDAEREGIAQRVLARLRGLERVTREMLRYVRGERAATTDIEIGALLGEAAQVIEPLMSKRGIAFTWTDHTGNAILHGDRRGLAAALLSLLENAAQATSQGGKVRLEGMANSARVCICVSDTGAGIPAESFARVFEPFYSTRADGTGLGLAIVKSVVELHGGTIDVASSAGSGTRFTIILPRIGGSSPLAMTATAARTEVGLAESFPATGRAHAIEREAA